MMYRLFAFLFYRYYSKGPKRDVRYISTIASLALLLYMHFLQILILIGQVDLLPNAKTRTGNWLLVGLTLLPFIVVLRLLLKESDIKNFDYDPATIKKGSFFLIAYCVLNTGLLLFLIIQYHKGFHGLF